MPRGEHLQKVDEERILHRIRYLRDNSDGPVKAFTPKEIAAGLPIQTEATRQRLKKLSSVESIEIGDGEYRVYYERGEEPVGDGGSAPAGTLEWEDAQGVFSHKRQVKGVAQALSTVTVALVPISVLYPDLLPQFILLSTAVAAALLWTLVFVAVAINPDDSFRKRWQSLLTQAKRIGDDSDG